jgi:2-polyprenyl-3-methyl-5-hydroxy-6-metoxy-1,4-benzoquinol methylase
MTENYRIVTRSDFGFKQVDPLPKSEDVDSYYQDSYCANITAGGRADEMRRSMEKDEEAEQQRVWLEKTFFDDVRDILERQAPGQHVFDVGCGTGDLLAYLARHGYQPFGVEPSFDLQQVAAAKGLPVEALTMDAYMQQRDSNRLFDAVLLLNVLEHVTDPVKLMQQCRTVLGPDGICFVRVPNDFSPLQLAAQAKNRSRSWWVTLPDHVNYFDAASLRRLMEGVGFTVVEAFTDFPMELFLLMGEDYVAQPSLGKVCHQKRVAFELATPTDVRRRLYRSLAEQGIGRTCMLIGRVV